MKIRKEILSVEKLSLLEDSSLDSIDPSVIEPIEEWFYDNEDNISSEESAFLLDLAHTVIKPSDLLWIVTDNAPKSPDWLNGKIFNFSFFHPRWSDLQDRAYWAGSSGPDCINFIPAKNPNTYIHTLPKKVSINQICFLLFMIHKDDRLTKHSFNKIINIINYNKEIFLPLMSNKAFWNSYLADCLVQLLVFQDIFYINKNEKLHLWEEIKFIEVLDNFAPNEYEDYTKTKIYSISPLHYDVILK